VVANRKATIAVLKVSAYAIRAGPLAAIQTVWQSLPPFYRELATERARKE